MGDPDPDKQNIATIWLKYNGVCQSAEYLSDQRLGIEPISEVVITNTQGTVKGFYRAHQKGGPQVW